MSQDEDFQSIQISSKNAKIFVYSSEPANSQIEMQDTEMVPKYSKASFFSQDEPREDSSS